MKRQAQKIQKRRRCVDDQTMLAPKKSFGACTNQWASLKRTHSLDPKDLVPQVKEVEHSVENISRHTRQILL